MMQSSTKKSFHYHACANALGGVLDTPAHTCLPAQASVSLAQAGGHASHECGPLNHHYLIGCDRTYARVSGKENSTHDRTGKEDSVHPGWTSQVTTIIEGLNILQVVTADRVVAQVSVQHPADGSEPQYSFAGSHFDNLRVHGMSVTLVPNKILLAPVRYGDIVAAGKEQADELKKSSNVSPWAIDYLDWMRTVNKPQDKGHVLCSLVNEANGAVVGRSFAHFLDIPEIGKIYLAELVTYPHSVQLTMVRAELGCHVNGQASMAMAMSNGTTSPP